MNDLSYMSLALDLARNTLGQTSPNPVVGSVVVNNGEIVGMGAHLKAGTEHAEVHALTMAGSRAKGGTIYVTLEPCSHHGRTPPCADLIIERGIKRVVIACLDPNPLVSGKGVEKLKKANIEVEIGVHEALALELNKVFFHHIKTKKPFVTLKTATSLDGKIATSTGESKWITGPIAREDVHQLRHEHDGILVGVGTVLADNPSLTTRRSVGGKNPIRIILDHYLRTPLNANVVTDKIAETWIVTTDLASTEKRSELERMNVKVLTLHEQRIKIEELLTLLGKMGVTSLFVEGGSSVNDSFLRSRYINEVITYIAPKLIGGKDAPTSFSGIGHPSMTDVLQLSIKEVKQLGDDLKIVSVPKGE
ncbi:bifunctional diaminohydroxyphosphoribosylaminopyrimidine deaminase/5-amino-6-(5-phosphoribosylamino)uracil reductase RibD [Anaerobacillus alkaliphilus]|uniref:Riboflavin biosynthesis protein RibD n=1 Tax=Anaerobacillus alkaliphilus TaxID=1548597 RepID=A0A4Q0VVY2_9BACI|nr:bifunctional diaminohydroxyphosphoribosylaminopyrimidine deaminase/5-amino-6-(5-phosphoribosylamino)uracil reductase RibD [Anaerobacillus alkaliphilus]RXJ03853.1 bifunctional diaminohydroxyphosphoribosylaminopyrimidine deaminase/5-amino-6-(5-phosphoribosylamino)uracil reductase RibD [Anaerobacillus alkaliphilus]